MDEQTKRICENVFEIARIALRMEQAGKIDINDSRELFASTLEMAQEFEQLFEPDKDDDYLLSIEEYAERKLIEEFGIL